MTEGTRSLFSARLCVHEEPMYVLWNRTCASAGWMRHLAKYFARTGAQLLPSCDDGIISLRQVAVSSVRLGQELASPKLHELEKR